MGSVLLVLHVCVCFILEYSMSSQVPSSVDTNSCDTLFLMPTLGVVLWPAKALANIYKQLINAPPVHGIWTRAAGHEADWGAGECVLAAVRKLDDLLQLHPLTPADLEPHSQRLGFDMATLAANAAHVREVSSFIVVRQDMQLCMALSCHRKLLNKMVSLMHLCLLSLQDCRLLT